MRSQIMAKCAKVNEAGQVIRRFLVHGSKIRLCHWSGREDEDQEIWKVRPGLLPDFPDSEVSSPLDQLAGHEGEQDRREESVRLTEQLEVDDEALRTKIRHEIPKTAGPAWQECEDAIMYEAMSEDEGHEKVREWLDQQSENPPGGNHAEPMSRANHGASDKLAREQLWRLAQRRTDKDGKPRIPNQPNVKEPPDVSSQAAMRQGRSAERRQSHRDDVKQ